MTRRVVLTGNGLSVALNRDFALPNITRRFFDRLSEEHRAFIEHHMTNGYNQLDFEESIASIEESYDSLHNYLTFLSSEPHGTKFLESYDLTSAELEKHTLAIKEIIYEYTASILDLINGHVHKSEIEEKLAGFVKWLNFMVRLEGTTDFFTLNFDLLLETILLETVGTEAFMDFHFMSRKKWVAIGGNYQYYFNPDLSQQIAGNRDIKLHHLHGSLSSFKDVSSGRLFKVTTEALRDYKLYEKIFTLNLVPSIVTGGGKSLKVQQSPFSYYYNEFKRKMYIKEELCDELYIIGYSFRDEHINSAICSRLELSRQGKNPYPFELKIVDFAISTEEKSKFISRLNDTLKLGPRTKGRFVLDDPRIIFEGANGVESLIK